MQLPTPKNHGAGRGPWPCQHWGLRLWVPNALGDPWGSCSSKSLVFPTARQASAVLTGSLRLVPSPWGCEWAQVAPSFRALMLPHPSPSDVNKPLWHPPQGDWAPKPNGTLTSIHSTGGWSPEAPGSRTPSWWQALAPRVRCPLVRPPTLILYNLWTLQEPLSPDLTLFPGERSPLGEHHLLWSWAPQALQGPGGQVSAGQCHLSGETPNSPLGLLRTSGSPHTTQIWDKPGAAQGLHWGIPAGGQAQARHLESEFPDGWAYPKSLPAAPFLYQAPEALPSWSRKRPNTWHSRPLGQTPTLPAGGGHRLEWRDQSLPPGGPSPGAECGRVPAVLGKTVVLPPWDPWRRLSWALPTCLLPRLTLICILPP